MPRQYVSRLPWIVLGAVLLAGCDQLYERAGFPDPAKVEADGKAVGGACRHAGRGLEACYRLNRDASKAAVYAGWKEMNEYMLKNNMQVVEPTVLHESDTLSALKKKKKADVAAEGGEKDTAKETDKPKTHAGAAGKAAAKEH